MMPSEASSLRVRSLLAGTGAPIRMRSRPCASVITRPRARRIVPGLVGVSGLRSNDMAASAITANRATHHQDAQTRYFPLQAVPVFHADLGLFGHALSSFSGWGCCAERSRRDMPRTRAAPKGCNGRTGADARETPPELAVA
jgi:hypothetical protein